MPLEDTNPRLEAIIQEVKTRQITPISGFVPRADVLLVAEIERLRARLALADGLAEAVEAGFQPAHGKGCLWLNDSRMPCQCGSHDRVNSRIDDLRDALSAYRDYQKPISGNGADSASEL